MAETLLEGFEDTPTTGLYTNWTAVNFGTPPALSRTTSHVTQGTYSWNITASPANFICIVASDPFDVSSYEPSVAQFKLDVYIDTIDSNDQVVFLVSDDGGTTSETQSTPLGSTGSFTLTVPIGAIDDLTNINFAIYGVGSGFTPLNGAVDFYVDNIRADDGIAPAGQPIAKRTMTVPFLGGSRRHGFN